MDILIVLASAAALSVIRLAAGLVIIRLAGFSGLFRRSGILFHSDLKGNRLALIGHSNGLFSRSSRIKAAYLIIRYLLVAAVAVMRDYYQAGQIQLIADLILGLARAGNRNGFQSHHWLFSFLHGYLKGRGLALIGHGNGLFSDSAHIYLGHVKSLCNL